MTSRANERRAKGTAGGKSIWRLPIRGPCGIAATAVGLLLFVVALLGCSANRFMFYPERTLAIPAGEVRQPYEDVFFTATDGVRLNAWFFPLPTNGAPVILFCHGNAGNISHRSLEVQTLLESGANVFIFDYRGYGRSEGKPDEEGTYRDAHAAYEWLRARGFAPGDILVFGESLGGGVAAELARLEPVGGLVLQSTFTSVADVAAEVAPWLPVRWMFGKRYDTFTKLKEIKTPVLVMHSRDDSIIPYAHGERNYAAASDPKFFQELTGDHNSLMYTSRERYAAGVQKLLKFCAENRAAK